ncbi:hypothetical protein NC651_035425 [Populus alba x Populus x berolinensis]|nr:hypothetical protein NC651_035425 [Populus alba x Populus x berolinensis]
MAGCTVNEGRELAAAPAAVVALPAVEVRGGGEEFQLPTEDVFGEIERLWSVMIKIGNGAPSGE